MNDDPELLPVAVEGTRNVVDAAAEMGVRRAVYTSSYGAVHMNPNRSPDQVVDEICWSDIEFCKQTKNTDCNAKTVAEKIAMEEAAKRGIQLLVVVPAVTTGEMLQRTLNYIVASYLNLTGAKKASRNKVAGYVDVQDVARAHVLVYEDPGAHGRYLCIGDVLHQSEVFHMLKELFPRYPIHASRESNRTSMVLESNHICGARGAPAAVSDATPDGATCSDSTAQSAATASCCQGLKQSCPSKINPVSGIIPRLPNEPEGGTVQIFYAADARSGHHVHSFEGKFMQDNNKCAETWTRAEIPTY